MSGGDGVPRRATKDPPLLGPAGRSTTRPYRRDVGVEGAPGFVDEVRSDRCTRRSVTVGEVPESTTPVSCLYVTAYSPTTLYAVDPSIPSLQPPLPPRPVPHCPSTRSLSSLPNDPCTVYHVSSVLRPPTPRPVLPEPKPVLLGSRDNQINLGTYQLGSRTLYLRTDLYLRTRTVVNPP